MDQLVTYRQIHPWVLPLSFSRSPHPPPLAPLSPQDSVGPVSNRSSGCRPLPSLAFRWLKINPRKISHSHSLESNNHRREFAIRDDACLWITDLPFFRMLVLLIGWGLRKARSRRSLFSRFITTCLPTSPATSAIRTSTGRILWKRRLVASEIDTDTGKQSPIT